mmetsp:Transcript_18390/g.29207  ORF Transcript_18390/g.29207 Transcript_18390/m.29207 type:complete len:214 (+) Transcript_18390:25-666(+)
MASSDTALEEKQENASSEYNINSSVWPIIARKQGAQHTYERLKDLNAIIGSTSGLIAGFTFLVTNTPIDWKYDNYISKQTRSDIFGAFLIVGLITSLIATLLATAIYGFINLIGPHNEQLFADFIRRNQRYLGLPTLLLNISVLVMFVGASFAVGGLYSTWVYALYLILAIAGAAFIGAYFVYNQSTLGKQYHAMLASLPDYVDAAKNNVHSD